METTNLKPNNGAVVGVTAPDPKVIFHSALAALHDDLEVLKKDAKNPFFKSNYVPLPDMLKVIKPVLKKHGFYLTQPVDVTNSQTGIVNVVFSTIVHIETGLSDTSKLAIPDLGDMQKLGGAITYGRRYTLSALLALEERDDDGETAVGRKPAPEKVSKKDKF